jgi:O-antigen ligase
MSYAMYAVISGVPVPMDTTTLAVALIALWLSASLIWTDTRRSVLELFNWLSYLILFTAARTVPTALIALSIFPTAAIFAALSIYRIYFRREMDVSDKMFGMGNGNHNGAFMLIYLFVGLWLTVNMSIWFAPFLILMATALILTKCKAAALSGIVSVATVLSMYGFWPHVLVALAASITWIFLFGVSITFAEVIKKSAYSRIFLSLDAIRMIIMKPFAGWGLDSYRQQLPETDAIIMTSPLARKISDKIGIGIKNNRSHRVHNDHLEILVELGITGYLLFAWLFSGITYDPVMFGLFVAVAVNALFFFPLREVHTAAPFWVMTGTAAASSMPAALMLPVPAIIVVCAIALAIMFRTVRVFLGQWYSELAKNKPGITEDEKRSYIDIALKNDPHNGGYLNDAAFYYAKKDPVRSFGYAARSLFDYDGTRVLHGVYDLFARTLNTATADNLLHWAENNALRLEPGFPPALTIKDYLAWKGQQNQGERDLPSRSGGKVQGKDHNRIITMKNHIIQGVRR